jgi:hypothetical protein
MHIRYCYLLLHVSGQPDMNTLSGAKGGSWNCCIVHHTNMLGVKQLLLVGTSCTQPARGLNSSGMLRVAHSTDT